LWNHIFPSIIPEWKILRTTQSLVPPSAYCYRVVIIGSDEVLSTDIERFGYELREFPWHGNYKQVLCPYWKRTGYGMVRCEYLEVEGLDEAEADARRKAIAHFGSKDEFFKADRSRQLYDEVKICGVKEDEEEDWAICQKD
jgi:hypothetical protein